MVIVHSCFRETDDTRKMFFFVALNIYSKFNFHCSDDLFTVTSGLFLLKMLCKARSA